MSTATRQLIEQLGVFSDRMGGMADVVKHVFRAAWVGWCAGARNMYVRVVSTVASSRT